MSLAQEVINDKIRFRIEGESGLFLLLGPGIKNDNIGENKNGFT